MATSTLSLHSRLRNVLRSSAHNLKEFEQILSEKFNIKFKISRGRISYIHSDRDKPITGRNLGTHYEKDHLMGVIENNSHLENTEKDQTVQKEISPEKIIHDREHPAHQQEISAGTEPPSTLFEKSGLRLVTDLQHCVKAQQSKAYAGKVKLSNLQTMAKTLSYIQEHGYNTVEDAEGRLAEIKELANKSVYAQFLKSKNKGQFRQEHSSELALYEAAVKFLKGKSGGGKLPSMKLLKEEKEKLLVQKKDTQEKYYHYRDYQKELDTVCTNIHSALGQQHTRPARKQEREEIS